MQDNYTQDFDLIRDAAQEAGKLALSYWGRSIQKQRKADGSEVTEADHAVDELLALDPPRYVREAIDKARTECDPDDVHPYRQAMEEHEQARNQEGGTL